MPEFGAACACACPLMRGGGAVLQQGDVLKVDFGVHVKGRIVDSAFTLTWDHKYDKLIEAVKAATDTGIRVCGVIHPAGVGADFRSDYLGSRDRCPTGRYRCRHPGDHGVI